MGLSSGFPYIENELSANTMHLTLRKRWSADARRVPIARSVAVGALLNQPVAVIAGDDDRIPSPRGCGHRWGFGLPWERQTAPSPPSIRSHLTELC